MTNQLAYFNLRSLHHPVAHIASQDQIPFSAVLPAAAPPPDAAPGLGVDQDRVVATTERCAVIVMYPNRDGRTG